MKAEDLALSKGTRLHNPRPSHGALWAGSHRRSQPPRTWKGSMMLKNSQLGRASAVAIPLAVAVGLTGCAGGGSSTTSTRPTRIAAATLLNTLDPTLANTLQNDIPGNLLYDPVLTYDSKATLAPRVATEWEQSADLKTIKLTLRSDIKFHDGTALTAKDVVYTLDRLKKGGTGVGGLIGDYGSATADDDTHVTITLSTPSTLLLGALSKVYVVNSALVKQHEGSDGGQAWLASNEAGSGAYTLEGYTQGQNIKLKQWPDYWDLVKERPQQFTLQNITQSASMRDALRAGTLDLVGHMEAPDVATFKNDPKFDIRNQPAGIESVLNFNTQEGPTKDVRVRQALALAVNSQAHIDKNLEGKGKVASGPVPSVMKCVADLPPASQDAQKAKGLLKDAGYGDGKKLSLTMLYQPNQVEFTQIATLFQSNWRDIGVDVKLQATTFPNYTALLKSTKTTPALSLAYDSARYPDVGVLLNTGYHSKFVGKGTNRSQYSNPEVDKLLTAAITNPDENNRCEQYKQVQKLVHDDYASIWVANAERPFVVRKDIAGTGYDPVRQLFDPLALRVAK